MDTFNDDRVVESADDSGWTSPASLLNWATLPRLALKLTRACHLPQTEHSQLCALLQYEPAQLCRYLFTLQAALPLTGTITERLQRGHKHLLSRTLICAPRLDELFPAATLPDAEHFLVQHWIESLQCAFLGRAFARVMELPDAEDVFFAGLLYRVGELALLAQEKQDYLALVQGTDPTRRRQQEIELYRIDANQLSQRILQQLNLPQWFMDAALFHDQPAERIQSAHPVTRLIHVAHRIVCGDIRRFQDAQRAFRTLLNLDHEHGEMLLESALNQSFDVMESLAVRCPPEWLRQRLLPLPPLDNVASTLDSDLQQLRVERIQIKNILSTTLWLDANADSDGLLQQLQRSAYLLFGSRQLILFRYDDEQQCLRGENPTLEDAFETAVTLPLQHKTLVTDCLREQKAVASFHRSANTLSVIDLELMQYCRRQFLVALPVSDECQKWGCMVLAFDSEILNRYNMWQGALQFFAQQAHQALALRDARRHWQRETAHFERKTYEHRFKRTAHEINNPLSIAQNHLSILLSERQLTDTTREHAAVAVEQIDSASHILQSAIERMHGDIDAVAPVNINELIQDVLYLFSTQDDLETNIVSTLDERLPTIYIDENYLRQVLINLIKNATECCDEGNTVSVITRGQVNLQGRRHVVIQIQDDGPGLPEGMLDALFVDTHSRKPNQQGGMGLTIVKDLVEEMGGLISFQRLEDTQSLFTLYLPVQPNR